jgi:predicted RNase H-like nuclease
VHPPVLGIDWYARGWVAAVLRADAAPEVIVGADLERLVGRVPDAACIGIDMPIGLPATERECDVLARRFVGPRRSSVFMTPPAAVLDAGTYEEANERALGLLGHKVSRQAYALRANVRAVGALAERDPRIVEVHPEVSFRALAGEPLMWPKGSWNGQAVRRAALERAGIVVGDRLDEAGGVPVADVLDALVAAWSARRCALGHAGSVPPGAAPGTREVIWY